MNHKVLSIKNWVLTHPFAIWGEGIVVAVILGLAVMVVWERA